MLRRTIGRTVGTLAIVAALVGCDGAESGAPTSRPLTLRERVDALLTEPTLVIFDADGKPTVALDVREGVATEADAPAPREATLAFDAQRVPPAVVVKLGSPATGPWHRVRPSEIAFVATLEGDALALRDVAGRTLRADDASYRTIVAAYGAAEAGRRGPFDALHRRLAGVATLERDPADDALPARLTLRRIDGGDAYQLAALPPIAPGSIPDDPLGRYEVTLADGVARLTRWDGSAYATFDASTMRLAGRGGASRWRLVDAAATTGPSRERRVDGKEQR